MSRIGKKPIEVPAGVTISVSPGRVTVNGPKGELSQAVSPAMKIEQAAASTAPSTASRGA